MADLGRIGEARFALLVTGEQLPMEEITDLLGLTPNHTVRKGDLLNKLPEVIAQTDEWIYTVPLVDPIGVDSVLTDILEGLSQRVPQLNRVKELGSLTLRIHLQSDFAQMVYRLTPETMGRLVEIGLPLEVSSLSWGEVDM